MRTLLLMAAVAGGALVLQTTLLHGLEVGAAVPDFLLVLCVFLGLYHHTVGGAVGAFVLGYVEDGISGTAAGVNSAGMCLAFLVVYLTSRRLWMDNVVSRVVVVFLASTVKVVSVLVLLALFLSLQMEWSDAARYVLLRSFLAAIVAPPVFAVLERLGLRPSESE